MVRTEAIRKHISDQYAIEEHIRDAIKRQRGHETVKNSVEVNRVVIEIERVLNEHIDALNDLAEQYDADVQPLAKEALSRVLGVAAGLYDKVRGKHPLSRDLRDNYTALGLASMGYTAFHTFGLAVKEQKIADLANRHLKDLTPLMVEISKVLPEVVAKEVSKQIDAPADASVGKQAVANTQEAWSPNVTQQSGAAEAA